MRHVVLFMPLVWLASLSLIVSSILDYPARAGQCSAEMALAPVVQLPDGRFANVYMDAGLALYLGSVAGGGSPVIPLYDSVPLVFASRGSIFVSTGLLTGLATERDFLDSLRTVRHLRPKSRITPPLAGCGGTTGPLPGEFPHRVARLYQQVERYRASRQPQLKHRSTGAHATGAPATPEGKCCAE